MSATEKAQMLMIKGAISDLSEADQAATKEMIAKYTELLKSNPLAGTLALAYVGLDVNLNPKQYGIDE